jgi:hypothetical protein
VPVQSSPVFMIRCATPCPQDGGRSSVRAHRPWRSLKPASAPDRSLRERDAFPHTGAEAGRSKPRTRVHSISDAHRRAPDAVPHRGSVIPIRRPMARTPDALLSQEVTASRTATGVGRHHGCCSGANAMAQGASEPRAAYWPARTRVRVSCGRVHVASLPYVYAPTRPGDGQNPFVPPNLRVSDTTNPPFCLATRTDRHRSKGECLPFGGWGQPPTELPHRPYPDGGDVPPRAGQPSAFGRTATSPSG